MENKVIIDQNINCITSDLAKLDNELNLKCAAVSYELGEKISNLDHEVDARCKDLLDKHYKLYNLLKKITLILGISIVINFCLVVYLFMGV